MKNHANILKWARDCLVSEGWVLQNEPKMVVETPWSTVICFSSSKGLIYLKQTPASLSLEPKILQLLVDRFHAPVPVVIRSNEDHHCFLMQDAGQTLRTVLKAEFQSDLLRQAIQQYTPIQRSTEVHVETFLALGVPDWRLETFPRLFDHLIQQSDWLKAEGLTDQEQQTLHHLSPVISEQCERLSQYQIPQTVVQNDFHTNNILFDVKTKKLSFIDWGETVISHPFFSLHTFLHQATLHHGLKEGDSTYHQIQDACLESWLAVAQKKEIIEGFILAKKLWPIYSALSYDRLIKSVDLQAFQSYYANRPNRLAGYFREYIASI